MNQKSYIVSGAGSGIGRAAAIALAKAEQGNRVFLLGRSREKLEQTRELLPEPGRHSVLVADVRDARSLAKAYADAKISDANLAGIVANAGLGGENAYGPGDRWDEILSTNLTGTYQLVQEALPALKKGSEPFKHIVVISSILARLGVPKYSAYCASKAGLLGLMRSWASEYASRKILVNALCPGWVETEMAKEGLETFSKATGLPYETVYQREMSRVPLGKMSQPEEIGALIAYLVSPAQTSITGQAFDINNGALMP